MYRVSQKHCKDVSIMSPQDEQWRRTSLHCILQFSCFTKTLCSQNINKQNVNIADETLTDYSFLCRYHYTKSKKYLKRRYRIRHWIPMFIGTPCSLTTRNFKITVETSDSWPSMILKSTEIFPFFYLLHKGIESLPETLIFQSLYLYNLML